MRDSRRIAFLVGFTLFLTILIISVSLASDKGGNKLTLNESIAEAIKVNWALKAKQERVDQSIFAKNQARSELLPKLGTTYGYRRLSEQSTFRSTLAGGGDIAVSSQDNYQWKGTLTQPLFTGFGLISSYELAKLGIDQSKLDVELEELDLALQVKEAYFNILIADRGVEVAEKDVESRKSNADVAKNFYEVGMIPINDLLQAEVELANAEQSQVRAVNAARLTRAQFNTVLSRPVNDPVDVVEEDIQSIGDETRDLDSNLKKALKQRPEIQAIDVNLLQTDQQIRFAESKLYPEVSFTYEFIKEGDDPRVRGSDFHDKGHWEALATLSWTFWEWGKTHFSKREQESVKRELLQTRNSLEDGISLEVKQAMLDLETAEKNIPTTSKAVEQGEENLRVSEERYKAQVTTITEVLDAQTRLTQARVNYFRSLYDRSLARARLLRAMGEY